MENLGKAMKKSKKVHLRGIPCKAGARWQSAMLTSTSNLDKVTCLVCLRIKK